MSEATLESVKHLPRRRMDDLTVVGRINDVPDLGQYFRLINQKLPAGGFYTGCVQTAEQRKRLLFDTYPAWIAWPFYILFFLFKRVLPKLKQTRRLYYYLTKGRDQVVTKTEVLGQLVYYGFEIVAYEEIGDEFYYVVQKAGQPESSPPPSLGPLFKMRRMGKDGRVIYVYKIRTMHPYAEYLQAHIYRTNKLEQNGKFAADFRVTTWGRFMRKVWLDELPMLINLAKGDLKLVGGRPLSSHYLSLYPPSVVERRMKHKPGLIPPFYADLPHSFDEIVQSEERYMEAYEKHPIETDVRYFCRAMHNIFVRRARSA